MNRRAQWAPLGEEEKGHVEQTDVEGSECDACPRQPPPISGGNCRSLSSCRRGRWFSLSARADTGLVALVHTQAAGDSGPIDSMMGRLQQLSEAEGFETRAIYAQDPATYETVLRILGDAGASIVLGTFPVISEAFKAVAPLYPDTKWIQLFAMRSTRRSRTW